MHELGIVYEVIRVVDRYVKDNDVKYVAKIVLEIGQLSQAIPRFIEECYPAAVSDTAYEDTELEIMTLPAIGSCRGCSTQFNVVDHRRVCPECASDHYDLISGQEFNIKEIVGY